MRVKKTPLRTCLACGSKAGKKDLVRIVRTPEGDVLVDLTGKRNGRGAYVCPTSECFERAVRKGRFASALRANVTEDAIDDLRRDFERVIGHQEHAQESGR